MMKNFLILFSVAVMSLVVFASGAKATIQPSITSFNITDNGPYNSILYQGSKLFSWTTNNASSVNFTIGCVNGLTITANISGTPFACGVTKNMMTNGSTEPLDFKNTTSSPINVTASISATGGTGAEFTFAFKATYFVIPASTTTTPSITVLSPNGGEMWEAGKMYAITWSNTTGKDVSIDIMKGKTTLITIGIFPSSQASYNFTVPSIWQTGSDYQVIVRATTIDDGGKYLVDNSDALFSIVAATTPSITVLSPNGGEIFTQGIHNATQAIKWTGGKNKVQVGLVKSDYDPKNLAAPGGILGFISLNSLPNSQVVWDGQYMTDLTGAVRWSVAPGSYKILLVSEDSIGNSCAWSWSSDGSCNSDSSDALFNIVASSTATTTFSIQLAEGAIVKSPDSPDVYVSKDGKKEKINSPEEFNQQGYKWDQIKTVQSDLLKQIEELKVQVKQLKEEISKAGALLKSMGSNDVYVVTKDGQRIKIQSPEEFNQKGYKWNQIQEVTSEELSSIPTLTSGSAPSASELSAYPNGTLIKSADSPDVYVIVNGQKRKIPDPASFNNWGYEWDQIKEAPANTVSQFSDISISNDIVRAKGGVKIYRIIGDKKIWIPTIQAFLGSGYKPNSEIEISEADINNFEDAKYIKIKGGKSVYEIKDNKKYLVKDTSQVSKSDIKPVTLAEFTAYPMGK